MSDIHSYLTPMLEALGGAGFEQNNPEHALVVCGDLFDRGNQTLELYEFAKSLGDRFIYIRGNHEDLLAKCIEEITAGNIPGGHHFSNGTVKTICQFCGQNEWIIYDPTWRDKIVATMRPILDWINEKAVDYIEIGDYILVHGWIPDEDYKHSTPYEWERARWTNGMQCWKLGLKIPGKTIVCGHWHCSYGWSHIKQKRKEWPSKSKKDWLKSFEPFADDGIIAIDACTAYTGVVNCIILEEK